MTRRYRQAGRGATTALAAFVAAAALYGCGRSDEAVARPAPKNPEPAMTEHTACGRAEPRTLAETGPGRITLTGRAQTVALRSTCGPLAALVNAAPSGHRFLLVVEDLRAGAQPGTSFDLKLSAARGAHGGMIGALNFFAAKKPGAHGPVPTISFDLTRALHAAAEKRELTGEVMIAIAPSAAVARGSDASIGALRLIEQ